MKKALTRIDHRSSRDVAEILAALSVQRTEGAAEGRLSQNTTLMCLETQVPNSHEIEAGICNMCVRENRWTNLLLEPQAEACDWLCSGVMRGAACTVCHVEFVQSDLEGEKSRRGLCQEDHCSAICADFVSDCRGHDLSIAHDSYRMSIRTTVYRDPTLLRSQRRRIMERQMGGSPKALHSIWQGKPACWETTGVQPRLSGPHDDMK